MSAETTEIHPSEGVISRRLSRYGWLTAIFVLAFSAVFVSNAVVRYQQDSEYRDRLMSDSLRNAGLALEEKLRALQEEIRLLALGNQEFLDMLALEPEDEESLSSLHERIQAYLPDAFASTLADPDGALYINEFEGFVGDLCRMEIRSFAHNPGRPLTHIHANPFGYHFDVMVRRPGSQEDVFFVSFRAELLSQILRQHQLSGHELILIRKDSAGLIEITVDGSRDQIQRALHLSEEELDRITFRRPVAGTLWQLVDLPSPAEALAGRRWILLNVFLTITGLIALGMGLFYLLVRSERKLQEAMRRAWEGHQQFEIMANSAPVGILKVDGRGICCYANQRAASMIARDRSALEGAEWLQLVAPEDRQHGTEIWQEALGRRATASGEFRLARNGDEPVWVLGSFSPLRDAADCFILTATDISEQKRRHSAMLDLIRVPEGPPENSILPELVCALGRSLDADYAMVCVPAGRDEEGLKVLAACRQGRPCDEGAFYPLAGSPFQESLGHGLSLYSEDVLNRFPHDAWLSRMQAQSFSGLAILDAHGGIRGILAVIDSHPISEPGFHETLMHLYAGHVGAGIERQRAFERLAAEKERAQIALEGMSDAVITTNRKGVVEHLNAVAQSLTGWSLEDARGQSLAGVLDLVREDASGRRPDLVADCLDGRDGNCVTAGARLFARTGDSTPVDVTAMPLRVEGGAISGVAVVFRSLETKALNS